MNRLSWQHLVGFLFFELSIHGSICVILFLSLFFLSTQNDATMIISSFESQLCMCSKLIIILVQTNKSFKNALKVFAIKC